jgi:hypothetical protein
MIFYTHERNFGCRVTEYVYRGLRTVTLENELLRVTTLADKGSDIFEFLYKPLDVDFMWRSPWGVRNPSNFVPTSHTSASSFLDFYEGGWQDCMPTGGKPCEYQGLPFGAHGETPTMPWEYRIVQDTPERIAVKFWVRTYRTPFYIEKELALESGKPTLAIEEQITNEGRAPMQLMWGQHPALGAPFLDGDCVIDLPGAQVHCRNLSTNTRFSEGVYTWPHVPGKDGTPIDLRQVATIEANTFDTIRLDSLRAGWYAVTNSRRKVGFGMAWPLDVFPALWFWQVYGGAYGPPWYGRTYNIALEPFSTAQSDIREAIANGSDHVLEPGQGIEARFVAVAFAGIERVSQITPNGQVIAVPDTFAPQR